MRIFFKGFKGGMRSFGNHVGRVVNTILLVAIYFFAVGPTSLIAKLAKKSFFSLKPQPHTATYWEDLNLKTKPKETYYKQF